MMLGRDPRDADLTLGVCQAPLAHIRRATWHSSTPGDGTDAGRYQRRVEPAAKPTDGMRWPPRRRSVMSVAIHPPEATESARQEKPGFGLITAIAFMAPIGVGVLNLPTSLGRTGRSAWCRWA